MSSEHFTDRALLTQLILDEKRNIEIKCCSLLQGANKEIREAIADPSPEVQGKAWSAVLPLVIKLKRCYEHSLELDKIVPKLLGQLVGGKLNPTQHLETQQALVKQLAEILEFVLKFDEYKVSSPTCLCVYSRACLLQLLPDLGTSNAHWTWRCFKARGSTELCLL